VKALRFFRHSGAPQASPEPINTNVAEEAAAVSVAAYSAPSAAMGSGPGPLGRPGMTREAPTCSPPPRISGVPEIRSHKTQVGNTRLAVGRSWRWGCERYAGFSKAPAPPP